MISDNIKGIIIPVWGFGKAGGDRVLAKLGTEFHRKGYKTLMLSHYYTNEPYYPIDCPIMYVDKNGREAERVDVENNRTIFTKTSHHFERNRGVKLALNRLSDEYNVVLANYSLTAYPVSKSRIAHKFYYIQAYEAFAGGGIKQKLKNSLVRKTYKLDLHRIVNADYYLDYKEIHSNRVVPPGLDLKTYFPKTNYWKTGETKFTVGCIGRRAVHKGTYDVIEAVKIIRNEGYDIDFKIAFTRFDDIYEDYIYEQPDGDNNLAAYYRSLDLLIAPCTIETGAVHYPTLEAMASGVPLISTGNYPANNDIAYIVPPCRPDVIAEKIKKIIDNYDEAIIKAERASERIKSFAWDSVSDEMLRIIEEEINME